MSRNPRQRRERRAKMSEEDEMAFYEKRFRERNPNFRRGTGGAGVISMNTPALVESMLDLAEMNPYDIDSVTDKDAVALSLLDDPTLPDEDRAVLAAALRRKGVLRNRPPPSSSSAVRGRGRGPDSRSRSRLTVPWFAGARVITANQDIVVYLSWLQSGPELRLNKVLCRVRNTTGAEQYVIPTTTALFYSRRRPGQGSWSRMAGARL
ncbi:uncharacterized protein AMSG_05948 [Thecamonas trahens ATCC 50062]|uniref:Uncharacterized protein n=1 Tax=Thecamonas trahens ATCC 50062 TaxID=461836 RepID=A0A0L0DBH5_THETB|nr:hypothetical protein AMSG_05948 [Thecamonas trahens ATCC 50062]KNC49687.1 hypothetical protein AMSG_05948 [Thecamonas trahens ATCC 50062]|eukprot:XP_013757483.1 hypothetical protein AMSG_05948 [Thecamonas trahens ATCC 50062]